MHLLIKTVPARLDGYNKLGRCSLESSLYTSNRELLIEAFVVDSSMYRKLAVRGVSLWPVRSRIRPKCTW